MQKVFNVARQTTALEQDHQRRAAVEALLLDDWGAAAIELLPCLPRVAGPAMRRSKCLSCTGGRSG
jgi:hypothetical protein